MPVAVERHGNTCRAVECCKLAQTVDRLPSLVSLDKDKNVVRVILCRYEDSSVLPWVESRVLL